VTTSPSSTSMRPSEANERGRESVILTRRRADESFRSCHNACECPAACNSRYALAVDRGKYTRPLSAALNHGIRVGSSEGLAHTRRKIALATIARLTKGLQIV
jgi:hypothetical protein